jgi:hypothetical protein
MENGRRSISPPPYVSKLPNNGPKSCYICHGIQIILGETGTAAVLDETQLDALPTPFTNGYWHPCFEGIHQIRICLSAEAKAIFQLADIMNSDLGTIDLHPAASTLGSIASLNSDTTDIKVCGTLVRRWLEDCIHPTLSARKEG